MDERDLISDEESEWELERVLASNEEVERVLTSNEEVERVLTSNEEVERGHEQSLISTAVHYW